VSRRQPDPDRLAVWRAFLDAHASITQTLEQELLAERDLPLTWYDVLLHLSEAGGRLRMAELSDRLLVNKSSLSRLCDRMEAAELVRRETVPEDARGVYAVLTGCSRSSCGTAAPTRLYYRFGFDGTVQQLDHQPVDVERQPAMLSRSPGEETYTRVGTHADSVTAVTVDNGPFIARFVVDSSGALIPIPPSAKRRAPGAPNR